MKPLNPLDLVRSLFGELQKPDPFRQGEVPIKRGMVAPLATYADGKTELALPGMPFGMAWDGLRSFGSKGFDTPEANEINTKAATDVAGGAMTGGLGVGLAGGMADNALGSAGGRLSPNVSKNLAGRDVYDFGNGTQVTMKDWPSGGRMVDNVLTDPQARGQGQARQALEYITREADQAGTPLKLSVAPGDTSVDPQRLQSFYQSLGFEDLGGSYMKRDPRAIDAADLPMDLASRMQRAREMGFDTEKTLLHGTRSEFDAFEPSKTGSLGSGVYLTNDPIYARGFAEGEGGRVLPVMTRGDLMPYNEWRNAMTPERGETVGQTMERARRLAEEAGYTGVQYGDNSQVSMFDPSNIRSVNAAFDPSRSDSANLLAANAKSGAAIPLGMEGQDEEIDIEAILAELLRGRK